MSIGHLVARKGRSDPTMMLAQAVSLVQPALAGSLSHVEVSEFQSHRTISVHGSTGKLSNGNCCRASGDHVRELGIIRGLGVIRCKQPQSWYKLSENGGRLESIS